jgi:hypothetical protein
MAVPHSIKRGLATVGLYSNRFLADALTAKLRASGHNLESLHFLPALDLGFVPRTSYSLSASAIRIILNDVVLHGRHCVVELGSGMSTLYLSKVLADIPGARLLSVDHDAEWLAWIDAQLRRLGTASAVRLIHAPLEPAPGGADCLWYARGAVEEALAGQRVDSLIVDGPKARHAQDDATRSHALPLLRPHLNPAGAVVFLDDIKRAGERRIYERWAADHGMTRVSDAEFCGLGILVPSDRPLSFQIV